MTATPDVSQKVYDDSFDEQLAEMLAQSQKAFSNYLNTLSDIEKQLVGQFRCPPKLESWAKYRCGLRSSAVAQSMAHMLKQQGWVEPPPGTVTMIGSEMYDGTDGALILVAPQEVFRRMKDVERMAQEKINLRTEAKRFDGLGATLEGLDGVKVDVLEVNAGEGTIDQVRALNEEARARRPGKRG